MERALAVGVGLNAAFVVAEVVAGLYAGSVALLADAGHNLTDVLGLALAWAAVGLARRRPSHRRTYGFKKATVLASFSNAVLLMVATGALAWESIERLHQPGRVLGGTVMAVAAVGLVVNGASAMLFHHGRGDDLNRRAAWLHLLADAAISAAVLVTGGVILWTGWGWLDGAVSLVVSALILASTWALLRPALDLVLDAVPGHIDAVAVRAFLTSVPGVREVHDLHIWALSTTEAALTAHLVVQGEPDRDLGRRVRDVLHEQFHIAHTTLQLEPAIEGAEHRCDRPACD